MSYSARMLGEEHDLTAQEMNRALVKLGILTGEPGNYILTEKGLEYGIETYHNRGSGATSEYSHWVISYDESIKDILDITPELKQEVRREVIEHNKRKRQEREDATKEYYENRNSSEIEDNDLSGNLLSGIASFIFSVISAFFEGLFKKRKKR